MTEPMQITNKIAMVRPISFEFNTQTAANDFFQKNLGGKPDIVRPMPSSTSTHSWTNSAVKGSTSTSSRMTTRFGRLLTASFPNNWFVSLEDGSLLLCPMFAEDRRNERTKFLGRLVEALGRDQVKIVDYTKYEKENRFLEGTGAMVLDRVNKKAYACLSERADEGLFGSSALTSVSSLCRFTGTRPTRESAPRFTTRT